MVETKDKLTTVEIVEYMCNMLNPTALPNPQSLTFTGGTSATYNGSSAITISIPTEISHIINSDSSLLWDGNNKNCFTFEDTYYKISDLAPTLTEAQQGGSITVTSSSSEYAGTFEFSSSDIVVEDNNKIYSITPSSGNALSTIMVCLEDVYLTDNDELSLIKKGVYATGNTASGYPSSITFTGFSFESTKIVDNYIPNSVVTYDTLNNVNSRLNDKVLKLDNKVTNIESQIGDISTALNLILGV